MRLMSVYAGRLVMANGGEHGRTVPRVDAGVCPVLHTDGRLCKKAERSLPKGMDSVLPMGIISVATEDPMGKGETFKEYLSDEQEHTEADQAGNDSGPAEAEDSRT